MIKNIKIMLMVYLYPILFLGILVEPFMILFLIWGPHPVDCML
jgi:hypothetical protein